ncbi:hypothetical protein SERLADRAFT_361551 [Serpula lacrymans var. lacrymans S7.9]|uniref:Rad51-like C-terminal domain-containing protein n=1 Tax=Serpula lacrymans var. lacrymans (strain S7.9) TaxID=578457 RepID=F8NX64_SERL9|nr:uncharacterized protein SERLADRAFT_361551 [Serpula lacrymans var. lacrymans S7.9]EGO24539.1 hypothetical protein SERLADRAFT_361551 [Serpula lacrymans var. lacrymans S7.9]
MRLRSLVPNTLPAAFVDALVSCGIRTDADLLFSGSPIDILSKLPLNVVSLADLKKYIETVAEKASAPGIRADDMLAKELESSTNNVDSDTFATGIHELDQLLTSKVLSLHIVLRHLALHPNSRALWIDTTADFSAQRTAMKLKFYRGEVGIETVLERLQVSFLFDVNAVHAALEALRVTLNKDHSPPRIRCIVIDSITSLIGPMLNAVSSHGHAVMESFMRQLRDLAQTQSLTVLVINNTSAFAPYNPLSAQDSNVRKPALGPSLTYMTDCTLWLAKQEGSPAPSGNSEQSPVYVAEVLRSKMTKSGTQCAFEIHQGVLYPHE